MRIECENCNATYTIDDSQLSDQPIGAQCPYCGHVKLVRRADAQAATDLGFGAFPPPGETNAFGGATGAPPPFGANGGAPPPFGGGGAPPPFGGGGSGGAPPPFGGGGAPPPFGGGGGAPPFGAAPPAPQSGGTFPPPAAPPFGGGGAPPFGDAGGGQGASPFGGFGQNPFGEQDAPPPASGGPMLPLGPAGQSQTAKSEPKAKCQVCGTELNDEFDKVIGLCDVHQRDRRGEGGDAGDASGDGNQWFARGRDGEALGPMSLEDLRNRIRKGELSMTDEFSTNGRNFSPISEFKDLAYLAGVAGMDSGLAARATFAKPGIGASFGRLMTPILVLTLVGGLGFLGYSQREAIGRIYTDLTSKNETSNPIGPHPFRRFFTRWKQRHPDLTGSATEHLATARLRHLEDTWDGYTEAERAFERAMLLDSQNAEAVAGYVENLALWRYNMATLDEIKLAEAAVQYALSLSPTSSAPYRAQAAMALARGNLDGCRSGAEGALQRNATDGQAKLLLSGCYMEGNVQLAISEAQRSRQILPDMRRSDRVLAEAFSKAGRYTSAFRLLDERLRTDRNNAGVHVLYGRIALALANYSDAARSFRKATQLNGDRQAAFLALAELAEEQRQYSAASDYYRSAARERATHGARAARIYSGWARSELLRTRSRKAIELADRALAFEPQDPAALLVRGQASLMAGSATTASTFATRTLKGRDGEPAALVLAGQAAARQRMTDAAIKYYEEAITNDPRDPRLKGILAATYLSRGGAPQAYALMRRAADLDPQEANSRNRTGPLALSPIPVKEALLQFRKSSAEERNASVASSAMGMLYYHLGERGKATLAIDRALRLDGANVMALIYKAQLALDQRNVSLASRTARRLLAVERGSALGHLQYARALALERKIEKAKDQYEAALGSNPGLLTAKVELAGLEFKSGSRERATQELQEAFRINPHNLKLRRLLHDAGI